MSPPRHPKDFHYRGILPEHVAAVIAQHGKDRAEALLEDFLPLERLQPEAFDNYLNLFFTYWPKRPFHVRRDYMHGFVQAKLHTTDNTALAPARAFGDLIARMLDTDRWNRTHKKEDRRPYWIALPAPRMVGLSAIDLDNKSGVLGYYHDGPSREHPSRPLPSVSVEQMRKVRLIYENFPDRIWCLSSATLGLHIWEKLNYLELTSVLHERTKNLLRRIGMGEVEVHPMAGRCFRRPFGADYFTIVEHGVLSAWTEQLDFFIKPSHVPSFLSIWKAMKARCEEEWARYERHRVLARGTRHGLVGEARRLVNQVDAWMAEGCPQPTAVVTATSVRATARSKPPRTAATTASIDLHTVLKGKWVQSCVEWARNGLPCDDSIFPVTSQLARWLYFIELFEIPESQRREKVEGILVTYCKLKHNGFISRANQGNWQDVERQIKRIVAVAIGRTDDKGLHIFSKLRERRTSGKYKTLLLLEPLLLGGHTRQQTYLQIVKPNQEKRVYKEITPDCSTLPASLTQEIISYYDHTQTQLQARRLRSINALLNYLLSRNGQARLGTGSLKRLGFNGYAARKHLKRLQAIGLIVIGNFSKAAKLGREFLMTEQCRKHFEDSTKHMPQAS